MLEVAVKLKFITPCLGNVRKPDYDRFERDDTGTVIFMSSWWREVLQYGAKALGKHQGLVADVRMHSKIIGEVSRFRRYYSDSQYKEHEAFLKGDIIFVKAMLPAGLPADDFQEILRLAGNYRGMSPYGWKDGYGQFEVIGVAPITRRRVYIEATDNSDKN